jgi:Protein of unknown function (DUF3024)
MAWDDLERKRIEKAVRSFVDQRRPPPELRSKVDLQFRLSGQSVFLFERRPKWREPAEYLEVPVAKATYVRSQDVWRIYWQRADLKWHRYTPVPEVTRAEDFLEVVGKDEYACFFG